MCMYKQCKHIQRGRHYTVVCPIFNLIDTNIACSAVKNSLIILRKEPYQTPLTAASASMLTSCYCSFLW